MQVQILLKAYPGKKEQEAGVNIKQNRIVYFDP